LTATIVHSLKDGWLGLELLKAGGVIPDLKKKAADVNVVAPQPLQATEEDEAVKGIAPGHDGSGHSSA
jgi:hypothetical protein